MKKSLLILPLALVIVAGFLTTGCEEMWEENTAARLSGRLVCGIPDTFDIIAGQHHDAGDILVWNCTAYVVVQITTHDPWVMTESHLAWADDCADLPRNKQGHLVPGQFPYSTVHDPAVTEYTYLIPIGDWEPGDTVALAFHCVVWRDSLNEETGWGGTWKGCFKFVVEECYKDVDLPPYPISLRGWHCAYAYWNVELAGIGSEKEYSVWNGDGWLGWCAEKAVHMYQNIWYTVTLLSSQEPNLPDRVKISKLGITRRWDCVNWLLNNKPTAATWLQIQEAIWYLVGETATVPGGFAGQMAQDAITYGTGFHAQTGDWIAVICLTAEDVQLVFIEVDP